MPRTYGDGSTTRQGIDERASIIRLRTRVGQLEHELAKKTCEAGTLRFEVDQCRDEIKRLRAENAEIRKWLDGSKMIIANMMPKEVADVE